MPRSKDRKESVRADQAPIGLWPRVIWLFAAAAWVFLAASLVSFDRADPPSHVIWPAHETAANWGGPFGASTAYWLLRLIGWSVALPMFAALATLWTAARGSEIRQPIFRALGVGLITAAAAGLFAVSSPLIPAPIAGLPGGSLGMVFAETLVVRFGVLGASIWLMLLALMALAGVATRLRRTA